MTDAGQGFTLALALHEAGWLDKAADGYCAVLRADPRHVGALHLLGMICVERQEFDQAAALLRNAVGIEPEGARLRIALGDAQHAQGDAIAAGASYRHALALDPASAEALGRVGILLRADGQPAAAATAFRRGLAVKPGDHALLNHSTAVLLELGESARAERALRDALAAGAESGDLRRRLADVLASDGRHEAALEEYERAAALRFDDLEAQFGRAAALEALGRPDEAAQGLNAAVPLVREPEALLRIVRRLFDLGDLAGAEAVYRRFAALGSDRRRFPGAETRSLTIRPAEAVCREHGWPYRVVEPSRPYRLSPKGQPEMVLLPPDSFLARIDDAEILPPSHAVIAGESLILDGLNTNSRVSVRLMPHIVAHAPDDRILIDRPAPTHSIEEEAILLGGGPNWSHGVLDWSSKLGVLERVPELAELPVLVAPETRPSILDLFEMLGLARERMRFLPPGESVRARRLWVPSLTHVYQITAPPHMEFLRRRLAGLMAEGMARPRRRLYLTRRQATYRVLVNEAEVLDALAPLGIEVVVPDDLSMAEQIKLFASAELIVVVIGGGSAAVAFAPPDVAYVELVHPRIALPQYGILTAIIGQRYRQVVGPARGNRGPSEFDYDFAVSPAEVLDAARALLDGP